MPHAAASQAVLLNLADDLNSGSGYITAKPDMMNFQVFHYGGRDAGARPGIVPTGLTRLMNFVPHAEARG